MKTLFGKENWKNISKGMPNSLYALSLSLHWWLTHPQTNPVTWLPSQISPKKLSNPPPSWVHGGDPCSDTFVGLTCDGYGRVTTINLIGMGLSGTLNRFLSSLRVLEVMGVGRNKLSDPVPSLVGMASLTRLVLYDNEFTTLPYNFFQGPASLMVMELDNLPLDPWLIIEAIAD
jgi:hypothetical protein